MAEDKRHEKAKARAGQLRAFYTNLITYVLINIVLFIINWVTTPGYWWFYWVTIFWGIAVLIHGVTVFTMKGNLLGEEWEEKKAKEIEEKQKRDEE